MIEPTLDDLLEDEIMAAIMRSSGVDAAQLKARLSETARKRARSDADGSDADGSDGDASDADAEPPDVALVPPAASRACHMNAACCSA